MAEIAAAYSPVSALVGGIALAIGVTLGLGCGVLAALNADRWPDRAVLLLLIGLMVIFGPMVSGYPIAESANALALNQKPSAEQLFPAGMIALTMLAFTLLGDVLRDAPDPKLRR